MRLGGPVFYYASPSEWIEKLNAAGYRAAYCPVSTSEDLNTIHAYATAAHDADIIIAETGAWSNSISPREDERKASIQKCQENLWLADEIGAICCVNIAGSRGEKWDGPHPDNLTPATFALIVDTVREILEAVKPKRAFYTLETMPWVFPDSVDNYLRLIEAINHPAFAVHFDPVNLVNSPQRYYANGTLIADAFERLGNHIKSCHAKDILLSPRMTVHLDEIRPGLGNLDYRAFLSSAQRANPDLPIMLEHLPQEEYPAAAEYVRAVGAELGINL
jgi:sugar phosphate isomerase/epimerase